MKIELWPCTPVVGLALKTEAHAEKYLIFTVKYGGASLMLLGYFPSTGPVVLVKVNGIVNFTKYQNILAKKTLGRKWIFQQDNNHKHISKSIKKMIR
jgi:hypothetical protein